MQIERNRAAAHSLHVSSPAVCQAVCEPESGIRHRRILVLAVFAAVCCLCCVAVFFAQPQQAYAGRQYGKLCSYYESGNNPGAVEAGVAYGAYQMIPSNAYRIAVFATQNYPTGSTKAKIGKKLKKAYKNDGNSCGTKFNTKWKKMGKKYRKPFFNLQYKFVKKNFYDAAVSSWQGAVKGFKVKRYSVALRNAIFSTAVQHGVSGSRSIFTEAMSRAGGYSKKMGEQALIEAIYAERSRVTSKKDLQAKVGSSATIYVITKSSLSGYTSSQSIAKSHGLYNKCLAHFYSSSPAVQVGVYNRLGIREPARALKMLKKNGTSICQHKKTTGGTVTYSNLTDTTHTATTSAVVCKNCGEQVKPASTSVESHSFTMTGASSICACGKKLVVHETGYYQVKATALNVRAKAKKSSALRKTITKKTVVQVSKVKLTKKGRYWGKIALKKKNGWVRMSYLSRLGTASTHSFVDGICIYCGQTEKRLSQVGTGRFTLRKQAKARSASYAESTALATLKKGKNVKVVEVVKNRYNDYWGQLKDGSYVKMSSLKPRE